MTIDINWEDWYLTLPIDKNGKFKGEAATVWPLNDDYYSSWMYQDDEEEELIFTIPWNGAKTENSENPRAELRQMNGKKKAAWPVKDGCVLEAECRIIALPSIDDVYARIVIGQFHGPKDELMRLYYDNGVLYYINDKSGSDKKETKYILKDANGKSTKIPMGKYFEYTAQVKDGHLTVVVTYNGVLYTHVEKLSSFWKPTIICYAKAGGYLQRKIGKKTIKSGTAMIGFRKIRVY